MVCHVGTTKKRRNSSTLFVGNNGECGFYPHPIESKKATAFRVVVFDQWVMGEADPRWRAEKKSKKKKVA